MCQEAQRPKSHRFQIGRTSMRGILLLICPVVGCTAHDSVQPEVPLPVKTMVLVSAEEPQVLASSRKVEASKKGRTGIPGTGSACPPASRRRAESSKGRN